MWPVLKTYDEAHNHRIALPLGGIGTGTVSLGGRGDLRDWEVMNRPAKGYIPHTTHSYTPFLTAPFFALYAKPAGGEAVVRALEGPIDVTRYEGAMGCGEANHGLPRFRECTFQTAYPLGQVLLSDADVPLQVRLEAFNPLIPGDAERSGLPVAVLRYVLINPTATTVTVTVCGNVPNFIGRDKAKANRTSYRTEGNVRGLFLEAGELAPTDENWGTLTLATTASEGISYRTRWASLSWGDSLLDFWDDFTQDGMLEERTGETDAPMASLAVQLDIPAGETREVTFLLAWHFPNRYTWTPAAQTETCGCGCACTDPNLIGNYYTTRYRDAWHIADSVVAQLPQLEADTLQFVNAFCASALPEVVKEAALFNISTLRSQTCFRTPDGRFYGWEGCCDGDGCCHGSCTHVWNYEQALAFLFGDLSMGMREVEFGHATDDDGLMSFRVHLPISRAQEFNKAAADGQMGCLMKLYRDWQLSGDDAMLQSLWPHAKRALEFCWLPGGWDADRDGVMEGCQHNTMDVEYYGPNPQMGTWYLGALRATEEMARYLGDTAFADTCRDLFTRGSAWMDAHLFNGEYYEHEIRPPMRADAVLPSLQVGMGSAADNLTEPVLQLGAGCLVDQLVGQYMAHVCGLGYLLQPEQVRTTLQHIMAYNFLENFSGHFNHLRSYVLGDESALLMATYPKGRRPQRPLPLLQ